MKIGDLIKIKKYTLLWDFPNSYYLTEYCTYEERIAVIVDKKIPCLWIESDRKRSYNYVILLDSKFFVITNDIRFEVLDI